MRVSRITFTLATILLSACSVLAQDRKPLPLDEQNKYVVSAKAGVVSFVEGKVTVKGEANPTAAQALAVGDELRMSDTVATGASSRVEILLNPGCYLRLSENSEFVFLFDGFVSNEIKLLRGSAVLEASAVDGLIRVQTPKANLDIARNGIYRFNVAADGRAEVAVRKGRAFAGKTSIKGGKRAVVAGETATLARLNKKDADELDDWSKDRARTLIAANRQLSGLRIRSSFISFGNCWVYDPFCRCYAFLPYGQGYSSPYGWAYSYWLPPWYYSPRYNNGEWISGGHTDGAPAGGATPLGGGHSGGSSGSHPGSGGSQGGGSVQVPPPTTPPSRSEPRGVDGERSSGPRRP